MNMKKIFAAMAATAISAGAFAAMSINANAAVSEIAYTESANSLSTDNDGKSVRRNIYNIWTTPSVEDIAAASVIEDNVTINFTVEGLNEGDVYNAWIAGSIGANPQVWTLAEAGDDAIEINGNGDYSVTWNLAEDSENVDCLILQTDINFYSYGDFSSLEGSGINLKVNSITTGVEDPTEATTAATTAATDGETTAATTKKEDSKSTTTTKKANGGKNETSTKTGDAGVGIAVAAIAVAGAAAFVVRKKD